MVKPDTLIRRPSMILSTLGGAVGTLLLLSALHLAPLVGLPQVSVPGLLGAVFTANPAAAFWIGHALFFVGGVAVIAPALTYYAWTALPGHPQALRGSALRGLLFGAAVFLMLGLLLPLLGVLAQMPEAALPRAGFFALSLGLGGAVALLVASVLYALALALISFMGQNLSPLDMLGWTGTGKQGERHEPT